MHIVLLSNVLSFHFFDFGTHLFGCVLCFAFCFALKSLRSLFLKTWRVKKLFGNKTLTRVVLPNKYLLQRLSVLLLLDSILIAFTFGFYTPAPKTNLLQQLEAQYTLCAIPFASPPLIILVIEKLVLLVYGVGLSFSVNRLFQSSDTANKQEFNESKSIGYCLNNTFLFLAVIVPIMSQLNSSQWTLRATLFEVMLIGTSQFNAIILFAPKIIVLYQFSVTTNSTSGHSHTNRIRALINPKSLIDTSVAQPRTTVTTELVNVVQPPPATLTSTAERSK
eukprot:c9687_g1_i2.p1 GENE.c9687_g1_i2~~c9687_g1_i2.p1  ORF type:complete len:278 (-),score=57.66 c9687_g1_i2:163-996(-)